jgi:hypothetical protein
VDEIGKEKFEHKQYANEEAIKITFRKTLCDSDPPVVAEGGKFSITFPLQVHDDDNFSRLLATLSTKMASA